MMRTTLLAPLVLLAAVTSIVFGPAPGGATAGAQSAATPSGQAPLKDRFVGTWQLVGREQRNAKGEIVPPPAGMPANRTGYIIYDPAGYMAVAVMPMGRRKYAAAQPTEDEAQAAITGYTAYFGTFTP